VVVTPVATGAVAKLTNKQVAEILVARLNASFTSVKGVTGTEKTGAVGKGKTLDGSPTVPDGFCGLDEYAFDTYPTDFNFPYFFDPKVDTITGNINGSYEMFTKCNNTGPYGYEFYRKMSIGGNGPGGFFFNDLEQDYTVKSLNADYSQFSLEGYMNVNDNWVFGNTESRDTATYKPGVTFVFKNGRPDLTGTATFTHINYYISANGKSTKTGYYDTYTFTGNFTVKVTFLQTGTPDVYTFTY
jgi:hypothetical protein